MSATQILVEHTVDSLARRLPAARRLLGALALCGVLSACASLPGGRSAPTAAEIDAETARTELASLEAEVARLKSQNARLANEVLALQRERDQAEAEERAMEDAADQEASLPPAPTFTVGDNAPLRPVVDDAASPALAQTDVPVQTAPRLVQPTFASDEIVFENEAGGEIRTASVLYGVHLASYRQLDDARAGWRQLQRENPDELGLLEPRVDDIVVDDKGAFLRLIGGGFSSRDKAEALCAQLKSRGLFCSVAGFNGERLSLAETRG